MYTTWTKGIARTYGSTYFQTPTRNDGRFAQRAAFYGVRYTSRLRFHFGPKYIRARINPALEAGAGAASVRVHNVSRGMAPCGLMRLRTMVLECARGWRNGAFFVCVCVYVVMGWCLRMGFSGGLRIIVIEFVYSGEVVWVLFLICLMSVNGQVCTCVCILLSFWIKKIHTYWCYSQSYLESILRSKVFARPYFFKNYLFFVEINTRNYFKL